MNSIRTLAKDITEEEFAACIDQTFSLTLSNGEEVFLCKDTERKVTY